MLRNASASPHLLVSCLALTLMFGCNSFQNASSVNGQFHFETEAAEPDAHRFALREQQTKQDPNSLAPLLPYSYLFNTEGQKRNQLEKSIKASAQTLFARGALIVSFDEVGIAANRRNRSQPSAPDQDGLRAGIGQDSKDDLPPLLSCKLCLRQPGLEAGQPDDPNTNRPNSIVDHLYESYDPRSRLIAVQGRTEGQAVNPLVGDPEGYERGVRQTYEIYEGLAQDKRELISLNFIRRPLGMTRLRSTNNDPLLPLQWHYGAIRLREAWKLVTEEWQRMEQEQNGVPEPVVVAVIDTGVKRGHEDLHDSVLFEDGFDFVSNSAIAADNDPPDNPFSSIDDDADDPGDEHLSFHGTHVAGTIAALIRNGLGGAGAAGFHRPGWRPVKILPIRVLGIGGGTDADIVQGILYAAGLPNISGKQLKSSERMPRGRADIINLSLGGPGYSAQMAEAVKQAQQAGSIVVAAAGNDGTAEPSYPAALEGVIGVGAMRLSAGNSLEEMSFNPAPYSNFGPNLTIMAPGGDTQSQIIESWNLTEEARKFGFISDGVLSTIWTIAELPGFLNSPQSGHSEYAFYQGTSMAAPHVSAVLALMKSVDRNLDPENAALILYDTTSWQAAGLSEIVQHADERLGFGLIDAEAALIRTLARKRSNALVPHLDVFLVRMTGDKRGPFVDQKQAFAANNFAFEFTKMRPGRYSVVAGFNANKDDFYCQIGEFCGHSATFEIGKKDGQKKLDTIAISRMTDKTNIIGVRGSS